MQKNFSIINDVLAQLKNNQPYIGYVYVISLNEFYKIGMSSAPHNRVSQIQTAVPYKVKIEAIIPSTEMEVLEKNLHLTFKHKRVSGEWFLLDTDDLKQIMLLIPEGFVYSAKKTQTISESEFFSISKKPKIKNKIEKRDDEIFPF